MAERVILYERITLEIYRCRNMQVVLVANKASRSLVVVHLSSMHSTISPICFQDSHVRIGNFNK